jgi:hypothetical protein
VVQSESIEPSGFEILAVPERLARITVDLNEALMSCRKLEYLESHIPFMHILAPNLRHHSLSPKISHFRSHPRRYPLY